MALRLLTTRFPRAGVVRLVIVALASMPLSGCQSNSERDLIARDRRLQEDQIYALQDYINQYQRLVCRYRSENAALRRQLTEGTVSDAPRREPTSKLRSRNGSSPPTTAPQFQPPQTPGTQRPEPERQSPDTPDVPPLEIEKPDVPPLKSGTSNAAAPKDVTQSAQVDAERENSQSPLVLQASHDELADAAPTDDAMPVSNRPLAARDSSFTSAAFDAPTDVMVCGEVVANESGGGPRLMIDVVPFDSNGRVVKLEGRASLMLLVAAEGKQRNLGRWDYGPDDVRAAIDPNGNEPSMRFFIELPADASTTGATQLWVRLVPQQGSKLLAHANVTLDRPGVFSSNANRLWSSEEAVAAASYIEPPAPSPPALDESTRASAATVPESSWAIAEPGKPANLPEQSSTESGEGWKASTTIISEVLASSVAVVPKKPFDAPRRETLALPQPSPPARLNPPAWSPDRVGGSSTRHRERIASRPTWAASR